MLFYHCQDLFSIKDTDNLSLQWTRLGDVAVYENRRPAILANRLWKRIAKSPDLNGSGLLVLFLETFIGGLVCYTTEFLAAANVK
jgi:hypothetical protein